MPLHPVQMIVDDLPPSSVVHIDCRLTRRRDPAILDDAVGDAATGILNADTVSARVGDEEIGEATVNLPAQVPNALQDIATDSKKKTLTWVLVMTVLLSEPTDVTRIPS